MIAGVLGETALVIGQATDDIVVTTLESTASMAAIVRQGVLRRLFHTEQTTRAALAEDLAEADPIAAEADRLEVQLHHDHLPTLEDEEFIEYDPETGEVRRAMDPETIVDVLDGDGK